MTYTDGLDSFQVNCSEEFGSVHRVRFVEAIVKRLQANKIHLGKRVKLAERETSTDLVSLHFEDGTSDSVDVGKFKSDL